jgi:hypothetical protein
MEERQEILCAYGAANETLKNVPANEVLPVEASPRVRKRPASNSADGEKSFHKVKSADGHTNRTGLLL